MMRSAPKPPSSFVDLLSIHSNKRGLCAALWLVAVGSAGPAFALQPLSDFLAGARRANVDLQVAAANIEQQEAESLTALGRALPSLTARGVYTRNQFESSLDPSSFLGGTLPPGTPAESLVIQPLNQLEATFQLEAPLIDIAAWRRVAAQRANERASRQRARVTLMDVQMQVARNYYQLIGATALHQSAERRLNAAQTNLELTRARWSDGVATALDVNRAEAEVERAQRSISDAQLSRALARKALLTLTGIAPRGETAAPPDDLHPEQPLEQWALRTNDAPSVTTAAAQRQSAEVSASAARFDLLPTLSAAAQERLTNAAGFVGRREYYVLNATLSWRLDLASVGAMRAAAAAANAARLQEEGARLSAWDRIHEAWHRVNDGIARSRAARAEAQASAAAVGRARERYQEGAGTQFELVQAERDAFDAEVSRIQADADLSYARVVLRLNAGQALDEETSQP